jgi:hypothetical protein
MGTTAAVLNGLSGVHAPRKTLQYPPCLESRAGRIQMSIEATGFDVLSDPQRSYWREHRKTCPFHQAEHERLCLRKKLMQN